MVNKYTITLDEEKGEKIEKGKKVGNQFNLDTIIGNFSAYGKRKRSRREGLRGFILSQIEERGPIPFSQFMEWCLYHPEYGYYRQKEQEIGKDGDYYTSPCVHPLFGDLIAKQLLQMAEILGSGSL